MSGYFPLTPALSLGEREKRSQRLDEIGLPLNANPKTEAALSATSFIKLIFGCSFSPREKVRMRGNGT
jgi:hypothetical protein